MACSRFLYHLFSLEMQALTFNLGARGSLHLRIQRSRSNWSTLPAATLGRRWVGVRAIDLRHLGPTPPWLCWHFPPDLYPSWHCGYCCWLSNLQPYIFAQNSHYNSRHLLSYWHHICQALWSVRSGYTRLGQQKLHTAFYTLIWTVL